MQADSLINLCAREYNDVGFNRILAAPDPASNLANWLDYLNDAQRTVCILRPDALTVLESFRLAPGTRQSLPAGRVRLLDVTRNTGIDGNTPGDVISFVEKESQDMAHRSWHSAPVSTTVRDVMYADKKDPLHFWVSPPVHDTQPVYIEAVMAKVPDTLDDITDPIELADVYAPPMQQWMLYRAHALATQSAGQFGRAQFYFSSFFNILGVKIRTDMFYAAGAKMEFPQNATASQQ